MAGACWSHHPALIKSNTRFTRTGISKFNTQIQTYEKKAIFSAWAVVVFFHT